MIQHVSIECRRDDEPALLRFWAALGFAQVDPPPALAERATWLQAGPTQIHLLWADAPVVPPQGHLAVLVCDYEATLAALAAAGFDTERRREHWGQPRAFTWSPGGHLVEIFDTPPR